MSFHQKKYFEFYPKNLFFNAPESHWKTCAIMTLRYMTEEGDTVVQIKGNRHKFYDQNEELLNRNQLISYGHWIADRVKALFYY